MIADKVFNIIEGDSRLFPSDIPIKGKLYLRVFKDTQGQGDWDIVDESEYIVANDTVVFSVEPKGKYLVIQVSTTPSELTQTPTENTMILAIQDEIVSTALIAGSIVVVNDNISQIVNVNDNIEDIKNISLNLVGLKYISDNLSYILQTQGLAQNANQSAQNALVSEQNAENASVNANRSEQNALESAQNANQSSRASLGYKNITLNYLQDVKEVQLEISTRRHEGEYISMDLSNEDFGDVLLSSPLSIENNAVATDLAVSFGELDCGNLI